MKIVSSQQMAEIESNAYQHGFLEEDFMENAGKGIALAIQQIAKDHLYQKYAVLLCGKGNNAGDAYVAGLELLKVGYRVATIQIIPISSCSKLCQKHHARFIAAGGEVKKRIDFCDVGFFIDGIFGTGFRGAVEDPYASIIQQANASKRPIFAVDIPSGLKPEIDTWNDATIIHAAHTLYLGLPKNSFFLGQAWNYVGILHYIDFGLPQQFIDACCSEMEMLTSDMIKSFLPPIKRTRHKYERGYVVALAGSFSMPGAANLACNAALRGGAGIVRLLHPKGMESVLSGSAYEVIKQSYDLNDIDGIVELMNHASAVLIGPGLGRDASIYRLLHALLPRLQKPAVIDADALDFLAQEDIPLPSNTILTPHRGEMERLLRMDEHQKLTEEFLQLCQKYADKKNTTLVLKGAPTFIFHSDSLQFVNPTGDPGMATAGSGDVLTGLLAALLAQGIPPLNAAMTGVYLHGLAGEEAAKDSTSQCMIASDILEHFPHAYRRLL